MTTITLSDTLHSLLLRLSPRRAVALDPVGPGRDERLSRPAPTARPRAWNGLLGERDPATGIWPGLLGLEDRRGQETRR